MAQKNMNRDTNKSQTPNTKQSGTQQVRGSELREKMDESFKKGEEFRRENQGADQMRSEVNRTSADARKDTDTKRKVP